MKIFNRKLITLLIIAGLAAASGLYLFGHHGYTTLVDLQKREDSLVVVRDSLLLEYKTASERVGYLKEGDPAAILDEARRLNLSFPEEEMIIINVDSSSVAGK